MKKFFSDFKEFAMKGNIIDMAIGVVIGTAFGKIVSSLVDDIIMPLVTLITGKVSFTDLKWEISADSALTYGNFIQAIVDFLIIALSIFLVMKAIMKAQEKAEKMRKKEEEPVEEEEPAETELDILKEIRDSLKKD